MSLYAESRRFEEYMEQTFGQFNSPEYAQGFPIIVDKGVVFLSASFTTMLMQDQRVRNVYDLNVYFSYKEDGFAIELVSKKLDDSYQKLELVSTFGETQLRFASYCSRIDIVERFKSVQNIVLPTIPQLGFVNGQLSTYNQEMYELYVLADKYPLFGGGFKYCFNVIRGEQGDY